MSYTLFAIIPTYGQWPYVDRTVRSLFAHSPSDTYAAIYDDASPEWLTANGARLTGGRLPPLLQKLHDDFPNKVYVFRYRQNGGLIRSLNQGMLDGRKDKYILAGNSDLVFTPGWFEELRRPLDDGRADLVGPVSNAAGITCDGRQDVRLYLPDYRLTDDDIYLAEVAARLRQSYDLKLADGPVNGFCMLAQSQTWWSGAFDAVNVFRPRNPRNSKGQLNPTPTMTLNEDELQGRWRKHGRRCMVAVSSFVFHYRSVSRGDRYKKPGWFRMKA